MRSQVLKAAEQTDMWLVFSRLRRRVVCTGSPAFTWNVLSPPSG
jgi:hypothetical protein